MNVSPIQSWLELSDGRRIDLSGSATVGRSPENAVVLTDEQVSRRHAIIQAQGEGEFWLVDLGSANGTYLNGRRISQPIQLHRNDVISLSIIEMRFHNEMLTAAHPAGKILMASTMLSVKTAQCWMLIADIIGSTQLAQKVTTEELPRLTGGWFKACREIIESHGGHIMKYLGDGFFCYWEAGPESAEQIRRVLADLYPMQSRKSPPFRIVLHYGTAALGSVPTMAEMNLHGPEVNFAFRIEKIAGSLNLGVMFSQSAHDRLKLMARRIHTGSVDGFSGEHTFFTTDSLPS
jgi:adenylate cyclase